MCVTLMPNSKTFLYTFFFLLFNDLLTKIVKIQDASVNLNLLNLKIAFQ